jgi:uracil-DNA glycosylase
MSEIVSSAKREMILREMGIAPIWKLRSSSDASAHEDSAEKVAATAQVFPTTGVTPAINASRIASIAPTADINPAERAERIARMSWSDLTAEIAQCTACKLCNTRAKAVPGNGSVRPQWVVIADAPSEDDNQTGDAFAGRSGQLLDAMLLAARKSRLRDAFFTHIVKCHPPRNRVAERDEISACAPFLSRQLELAKPALILAAGELAAQELLGSKANLSAMRAAPGFRNGVPVVATYHPSHLLLSPAEKAGAWDDLAAAISLTDESR